MMIARKATSQLTDGAWLSTVGSNATLSANFWV